MKKKFNRNLMIRIKKRKYNQIKMSKLSKMSKMSILNKKKSR